MVSVVSSDLVYDDRPPVLALGGNEAALARARAVIEAVGARATGTGSADPVALDGIHARLLLLDLHGATGDDMAPLLDAVRNGAEQDRWRAVMVLPLARLDEFAGILLHPLIDVVVDGDAWEQAAVLQLAMLRSSERATPMLHEQGARADEERLRRLTAEVGRIAQTLARISGEAIGREPPAMHSREPGPTPPIEAVRALVRARRLRAQYFDGELFADPAWDMLLDLYAARLDQHRVAVSSLCIASAVPATTALRWIKTLTDRGLFVRRADPTDGRRVFIELADGAANAMSAYFVELERMAGGAPWRAGAAVV